MRNKGSIFKFNTSKGGFGKIIDQTNLDVNFESIECTYDYVRVGDEVIYDLVQISDGSYEALNIEFRNNSNLSIVESAYKNQKELQCNIILKTPKGYISDFKGIRIYLPEKELKGKALVEGEKIGIYIQEFSNGINIIATLIKNSRINLVNQYQKYIGKKDSFDFEIININETGLIVSDSVMYGFIPKSHLGGSEQNDIKPGNIIKASVIACSITKGLILSIRNHCLYHILEELKDSYYNQISLSGEIKSILVKNLIIKYKDIELVLNKSFIPQNRNIELNDKINFNIINFSFTKTISISSKEIFEKGIMNTYLNENLLIGTVKKILDNGLLVCINEYYTGFMPDSQITENKKLILKYLEEGSRIKASITQFNCKGLYLSRIEYQNKIKKRRALQNFKVNDSCILKIFDKIAFHGIPVSNENVKGTVPIENILPEEVIKQVDMKQFTKHCRDIFKNRTLIKCIVADVDRHNNRIIFDLDNQEIENEEKVNRIIDYFEYNYNLKILVRDFYKEKKNSDKNISSVNRYRNVKK